MEVAFIQHHLSKKLHVNTTFLKYFRYYYPLFLLFPLPVMFFPLYFHDYFFLSFSSQLNILFLREASPFTLSNYFPFCYYLFSVSFLLSQYISTICLLPFYCLSPSLDLKLQEAVWLSTFSQVRSTRSGSVSAH